MRLGIDIGGTKIEAAALEADGTIRARRRQPTPSGDYAGIIATVKALVAGIEAELGPAESIGVGIPGTLSPATGLVKNANSTCLIGRPFDRDLAGALGRPVRLLHTPGARSGELRTTPIGIALTQLNPARGASRADAPPAHGRAQTSHPLRSHRHRPR